MAEGYAGLGCGFFKGVEVDDDHVDGQDAMFGDGGFVLGFAADIEQSAVDPWMEGLDAAVEHFREAGEFADVFDGEAGFAECFGGAAGGDELNTKAGQSLGKGHEAGFVGDT